MTFSIVVADAPDPRDRERIAAALTAFNTTLHGPSGATPVAVLLKEGDATVGGLWGRASYGWLYVELLFVPEAARGTGLGAGLMARAEAEARRLGCAGVWIDCFGARNRAFYERLGYRAFGVLDGQPPGEARHFLSKRLDAA